jgi:hypothetical protein
VDAQGAEVLFPAVIPALLIPLLLAQSAPCSGAAASHASVAAARAEAFDLAGASESWAAAAAAGCREGEAAAHFLRGLVAARDAYSQGGSAASLEPVKQAVAALEARGAMLPGIPQVERFLLLAAMAAAQSERDEMSVLLEHAIHLESIQLEARQGGAPGVTAHEAAGDLFLQVHRYQEARSAYLRAASRVGTTPRVRLGLARTAARLKDVAGACGEYRGLVAWWGGRGDPPPEIEEARAFAASGDCARAPSAR